MCFSDLPDLFDFVGVAAGGHICLQTSPQVQGEIVLDRQAPAVQHFDTLTHAEKVVASGPLQHLFSDLRRFRRFFYETPPVRVGCDHHAVCLIYGRL